MVAGSFAYGWISKQAVNLDGLGRHPATQPRPARRVAKWRQDRGRQVTLDAAPGQANSFTLLSSTKSCLPRRCELVRIDGTMAGVHFITADSKKKPASAKVAAAQNSTCNK